MVFDNCDDTATFSKVEQFIPQGNVFHLELERVVTFLVGRGNILFTSRHRDLEELGDIIEVPPMPLKAGV
jgi:hypothetical protein